MNLSNAYQIIDEGEPTPEEAVDLECPNCTGQFQSRKSGYYRLGDKEPTVYEHFVGVDNCKLATGASREYYTCPNGCTTMLDLPVQLNDIHEVGSYTPHERYECAKLTVRKEELLKELSEIDEQLKNFPSPMY